MTGNICYLPTNFRELISILESCRISAQPSKGLYHVARRPILKEGLRTSEIAILQNIPGTPFPVLLELEMSAEHQTLQTSAVPLSDIRRILLRTETDRNLLLSRKFENASAEGLVLSITPELFDLAGEPTFQQAENPRTSETAPWIYADQICGLVLGACVAAERHPGAAMLLEQEGLDKLVALALPTLNINKPEQAAASVMRTCHGRTGIDPHLLLADLLKVLELAVNDSEKLSRFRTKVQAILSSDESRRPRSLSDEGDILLRAIQLVIQRPNLNEVIEDKIEGELPGASVYFMASSLAGTRDGLARLSATWKKNYISTMGNLGSVAEDNHASPQELLNKLPQAISAVVKAVFTTTIPVCLSKERAVLDRVLASDTYLKSQHRIIRCNINNMYMLEVRHPPSGATKAQLVAQANQMVQEWTSRRRSRSRATKKASSQEKLF